MLKQAARAAGALAVKVSGGTLTLSGDSARYGLGFAQEQATLQAFSECIAPGEREVIDALQAGERVDRRLRLIGSAGRVHYVRLIGEGHPDWTGLLMPAGPSPDGALAAVDLETALRTALQEGRVVAYHQPVVALATGQLAGFEALARWEQAGGGVAGPDEFLGLATEQGLVGDVGDAVRGCAIRDAAAWSAAFPQAPLFIAANATASELVAPDFADRLLAEIERAGLTPSAFKLELSETEVMRDPHAAEQAMKTLRQAGISLVLDDFGTGYSSLSRLDRFPFDTVKIDQYFTRLAETDPSARTIISGVVRIARSYNMTIVAEGIETPAAAALCQELGCEYGQGFRFAQALEPQHAADVVGAGIEGRFKGLG